MAEPVESIQKPSAIDASATPLSQKINVQKLPTKGLTVKLNPDSDTLPALADYLDVVEVCGFSALLTVKRWHKDGVRVSGPLKAKVTQQCVVTLEPVIEKIDAEINAVFVPETSKLAKPIVSGEANEMIIDPDGDDVPEVFEAPFLDVGDVATEFVALEINPYPRAEGVQEDVVKLAAQSAADDDMKQENPFAALEALKDKL